MIIDLVDRCYIRNSSSGRDAIVSFVDYYHDTVVLANRVPIDETEILDYVIDRISDYQLRSYARMQRFEAVSELLDAFKKITLRSPIGERVFCGEPQRR